MQILFYIGAFGVLILFLYTIYLTIIYAHKIQNGEL